jgi:hypothetical protein
MLSARAIAISGLGFSTLLVATSGLLDVGHQVDTGGIDHGERKRRNFQQIMFSIEAFLKVRDK